MKHYDSDIDGFDRKNERLIIREKDIVSMLGGNFASGVYYLLTGEEMSGNRQTDFNEYLIELQESQQDTDKFLLSRAEELKIKGIGRFILACLFYENSPAVFPGAEKDANFLYAFSKFPLLISGDCSNHSRETNFSHRSLEAIRKKSANELEKKIFEMTLVSFLGGFGYFTPTTFLPRASSSVGSSDKYCLISGMCANGKYHIGAIEEAMKMIAEMPEKSRGEIEKEISRRISECNLPGFGHPLFKKDPRVEPIRKKLKEMGIENKYLEVFDFCAYKTKKERKVFPNIDGMNAVSLLSLGFLPEQGKELFAFARAPAMYAHAVEERTRKPYSVYRKTLGLWTVLPKCLFNLNFDNLNKHFKKYFRNRKVKDCS